ncbi:hypothetical protein FRC01_010440, partial [Tulasnella sp. 417]
KDDRFTRMLVSKTCNNELNDQIDFVALGFEGIWAFSVNGQVEYRCGKPFQKKLTEGQKARKKISTVVLSPIDRVWIIVWEDGTLSHNLPSNIAAEVDDYCQLKHSLKPDSYRWRYQQPSHPRYSQPATNSFVQGRKSTTAPMRPGTQRPGPNDSLNTTQPSPINQKAANNQLNGMSVRLSSAYGFDWEPTEKETLSTGVDKSEPMMKWRDVDAFSETGSDCGWEPSDDEEDAWNPYGFYVPPRKLSTTLRVLDPCDWSDWKKYEKVLELFERGWKHQDKRRPKIKRIFIVDLPDHLNESYNEYTADDYAKSPVFAEYKAMIVAKVALGKSLVQYTDAEHLTAPPWGYDSVRGEAGFNLNYDEQVVYTNEAVRPAYVIIYERDPSARMASAFRPPAGMASAFYPTAGMASAFRPPAGMASAFQPPTGMASAFRPPTGTTSAFRAPTGNASAPRPPPAQTNGPNANRWQILSS